MNFIPTHKLENSLKIDGNVYDASPIKIMILDPHTLFRTGLISLLKDQRDIEIIQDGSLRPDLLARITDFKPDIIIMGGDLYEDGGKELMLKILAAHPNMAILILAYSEGTELMLDVIRNGARGYLPMDFSKSALIKSLYAMLRGEVAISRSMTTKVVEEFSRLTQVLPRHRLDVQSLECESYEVLRLPMSNSAENEIALKFFISDNSILIHVSQDHQAGSDNLQGLRPE